MSSFDEKTELGLHGEHIVIEILRCQEGLTVSLNTGPGYKDGYGMRFFAGDGSIVIPDIQGYRTKVWPRQPFWVEVKTKTAFACYENADNELRTGIDKKRWLDYRMFLMTQGPVEFHFVFVHALSIVQLPGQRCTDVTPSIAGLYKQSLDKLDARKISGTDGKFYWPLKHLELWRRGDTLANDRGTKDLWAWLVNESKKRIAQRIQYP